jgi:hypothetical protein
MMCWNGFCAFGLPAGNPAAAKLHPITGKSFVPHTPMAIGIQRIIVSSILLKKAG